MILRTDEVGDIRAVSDGTTVEIRAGKSQYQPVESAPFRSPSSGGMP